MSNLPRTVAELARAMDHTLLDPDATPDRIRAVCTEGLRLGVAAVCIPPVYVPLAAEVLAGEDVAVCTVVGFPHGNHTPATKAAEAAEAVGAGAEEIDMVLFRGPLHAGDDEAVLRDVSAVVEAAEGAKVKVILETGALSDDEIARACRLAARAGAAFVKTSTGFGPGGATVEAVRRMRESVPDHVGVKASGGIRDAATAVAMLSAGATRLGVSRTVSILEDFERTHPRKERTS
ncbi:MAG: deoxyribose-phosphate aldolase [Deltaproteobacteria bacterium]|nr:MAG: deoxyribose-phosphate aldolase [Deltaproteobacteria bacterium]